MSFETSFGDLVIIGTSLTAIIIAYAVLFGPLKVVTPFKYLFSEKTVLIEKEDEKISSDGGMEKCPYLAVS